MSRAQVTLSETDLSSRVEGFPGVVGATVLAAPKGPIVPTLITSQADLLRTFTPDEIVKVGYSNAFFSIQEFLKKGNRLWVSRSVSSDATYGGYAFGKEVPELGDPVSEALGGLESIQEIDFTDTYEGYPIVLTQKDPGDWGNSISVAIVVYRSEEILVGTSRILTTGSMIVTNQKFVTGEAVRIVSYGITGGVSGIYYLKLKTCGSTSGYSLHSTLTSATEVGGVGIDMTSWVVGSESTLKVQPVKKVSSEDSFLIEVYKTDGSTTTKVESFEVTRDETSKDGDGNSKFIESKLDESSYIRGFNNPSIDLEVMPSPTGDRVQFEGGFDGTDSTSESSILRALECFLNANKYRITILFDSGYTMSNVHSRMLEIAELRKDCIAIISSRLVDEEADEYLDKIISYRTTTLNANSSYGAMYTPHINGVDSYNNRSIVIAPSGVVSGNISAAASLYELFYPVAGNTRGLISATSLTRSFDDGELDQLYDAGINPIRNVPGKGIVIWGQKTLSTKASKLDRLNVRLLLILIAPAIRSSLEDFLFELNDEETRSRVRVVLGNYLEGVKARRGVTDFQVICDRTNNSDDDVDNYKMNVSILIKPTGSLEYVNVKLGITSSGMSFDVAAANL